jgi:hypothetical protein
MERDTRRRGRGVNGERRSELDYDPDAMNQGDDAAEADSGTEENT